jgi:hypothetical protein
VPAAAGRLCSRFAREAEVKLTTVHQVLVIGFMLMASAYAAKCFVRFSRGGERIEGVLGAGSVLVALGAVVYLRRFRRKLAEGEGP